MADYVGLCRRHLEIERQLEALRYDDERHVYTGDLHQAEICQLEIELASVWDALVAAQDTLTY